MRDIDPTRTPGGVFARQSSGWSGPTQVVPVGDDGWTVEVTFDDSTGTPTPVAATLRAPVFTVEAEGRIVIATPTPVTAEAWRRVRLQSVLDIALEAHHQHLAAIASEFSGDDPEDVLAVLAAAAAERDRARGRRPPGRPREYGPEHYTRVAEVFTRAAALRAGNPIVAVAREVPGSSGPDDRGTSRQHRDRANRWVRTARERGNLPAARPPRTTEPEG